MEMKNGVQLPPRLAAAIGRDPYARQVFDCMRPGVQSRCLAQACQAGEVDDRTADRILLEIRSYGRKHNIQGPQPAGD